MANVKVASDFMRRKLVTLTTETDTLDGITRLLRDNISGAPVIDSSRHYLGVFSEKCCMNAMTEAVEAAAACGMNVVRVCEFMKRELITLSPELDVFEAIDQVLAQRISGAPVVGLDGKYLGIFSEKTAMRVLVAAVFDQLPGTKVACYMNLDRNRIVDEEDTLLDVAHKFQETPYRRLPVLRHEKLAGQISRRDVIWAEHRLVKEARSLSRRPETDPRLKEAVRLHTVGEYMDTAALTITSSEDVLSIAQKFLNSPYRRLPVVDDGQLVGQVSRRDLLEATAEMLRPKPARHHAETLYLSPLSDSAPPSLM